MVFLTRRAGFSAAHRYFRPELSDEENRRLFGDCATLNGHGHDYCLDVTVKGDVEPRTGLVLNITALKPLLNECVVDALDREFLTIQHPFCRGKIPTCENLGLLIWDALETAIQAAELPGVLHRVHLWESPRLAADCCMRRKRLMVLLTRTYEFSAAHRLHSAQLTDEENLDLFGKCNSPYGHGHNYKVEITLQGNVDPRTGMMADLRKLDRIIQEEVVNRFDHRNLNMDTEEFRELNPTSENLVKVIWRRLERRLMGPSLYKVAVRETDRNCFAYYGEGE